MKYFEGGSYPMTQTLLKIQQSSQVTCASQFYGHILAVFMIKECYVLHDHAQGYSKVLPGLDVIKQMLPAVTDVLDLVIDFCFFGLIASSDELFSQLFQMGLILTKEVDLLHTILKGVNIWV